MPVLLFCRLKAADQLDQEILALIAQGMDRRDDAQFNRLALDLFEYQFAHNQPYRNFCLRRGLEPGSIASWKEIPAVPTTAFKDAPLACFPVEKAAAVFETSGTTQSKERRGRHYLESTALYRASIIPNFAAHLLSDTVAVVCDRRDLPNAVGDRKPPLQLPMLILTPSPEEAPRSSLSFMMGVVAEEFGGRGSFYFVHDGHLEAQRLCDSLRMAENFGEPVMLLGTAFAFAHFFDWCEENHHYFKLPKGSRAMETGGFKGKSREMPRAEFYQLFDEYLLLPKSQIVNEYGMTELGVQFYNQAQHNPKPAPPWSRVVLVDPATAKEAGEGERGLIRIYDLTNRSSVMAVQTEDVGVRRGDGFEVLGRAAGAEARGCSIAADEFLAANRL